MQRALLVVVLAVVVVPVAAAKVLQTESRAVAESGSPAVVRTAFNRALKTTILVDARGMTLYYINSEQGTQTACVDTCATQWPPLLTTGKPRAAGAAKQSLLSTAKRPDGHTQVAYRHHLLYHWAGGSGSGAGDRKPGEVEGQGRFGVWWALSPAGKAVTKLP